MESDVVIRAEGLGKSYLVGHRIREKDDTLRDSLARGARELLRSAADLLHGRQIVAGDAVEEFWALQDVSFDIRQGEVIGIIGRNGAGKSTLLKVLSRITEPTEGRVRIRGRIASLLEVGTGFHPELTGRENIFLNGAILGMTNSEIRKNFDEIVDFSGVERFLDTPVKRYSSGMYVRLAFSVAAHLEPEILIVDEVLAVGDSEFQNKCLGKMQAVAGSGRTVLFVSHNRAAVARLCPSAIWLHEGRLREKGETTQILANYGQVSATTANYKVNNHKNKEGPGFINSLFISSSRPNSEIILNTDILVINFEIFLTQRIRDARLSVGFCIENGEIIFASGTSDAGIFLNNTSGIQTLRLKIPKMTFLARQYKILVTLWAGSFGTIDQVDNVFFSVEADPHSALKLDNRSGYLCVPAVWEHENARA